MLRCCGCFAAAAASLLLLTAATTAHAQTFLDLDSVTSGATGSFSGTLNGVSVTGSLTGSDGTAFISAVNNATTSFEFSTTNNSTPQYSYGSVYTPTIPLTDRVGYVVLEGGVGDVEGLMTITFSAAITNPIFHVANLDSAQFDFSPTPGLVSLVLLSGNGGGDGLGVSGLVISDENEGTVIGQSTDTTPFTAGPRSGYGSVRLTGTFTTISFNMTQNAGTGDGGSFTLSVAAAPEPSALGLAVVGLLALAPAALRRRNRAS